MHPVAARRGMRLFDEGEPIYPLRLLSSQAFPTGVLRLIYSPGGAPRGADVRRRHRQGPRRAPGLIRGTGGGGCARLLPGRSRRTWSWVMPTAPYLPVTFDRCDHIEGPFYHGTKSTFAVGQELRPGPGLQLPGGADVQQHLLHRPGGHGGLGSGAGHRPCGRRGRGHIYVVEPTGPFEDDPNVTNKRFPGNITQSYRSRHPLRVVGEVETWEGHAPDVLKADAGPPRAASRARSGRHRGLARVLNGAAGQVSAVSPNRALWAPCAHHNGAIRARRLGGPPGTISRMSDTARPGVPSAESSTRGTRTWSNHSSRTRSRNGISACRRTCSRRARCPGTRWARCALAYALRPGGLLLDLALWPRGLRHGGCRPNRRPRLVGVDFSGRPCFQASRLARHLGARRRVQGR